MGVYRVSSVILNNQEATINFTELKYFVYDHL